MLWGQSVDHETQERADALKEALRKALIPLGPIENVPGLRGLHGRAASRRTVEQVNRARQRIMDAIERDNEWLDAPRRNAETARKRRKRRGEGESE
ncbi:MAG: hypothetical protein Q7R30_12575 [Acidobacteriota bacterium]|nr:hypothetical protein [Acidobacteriota bacterium]